MTKKPKKAMRNIWAKVAAGFVLLFAIFIYANSKFRENISIFFGAFTAAAGALTLDKFAIIFGIVCTGITCGVNWYYRRLEFKRGRDNESNVA